MESEEKLVPTATSHQTNQHDLHHPEREEQSSHKRLFFGLSVQCPLSRKPTTNPSKKPSISRKSVYMRHHQTDTTKKKTQKERASTYHPSSITKQSFSRLSSLSLFQKSFERRSSRNNDHVARGLNEKKKGIKTDDGFFFLSLSLSLPPSIQSRLSI